MCLSANSAVVSRHDLSFQDNVPQQQLTYCIQHAGVPPKILLEYQEDHKACDQRVKDVANNQS